MREARTLWRKSVAASKAEGADESAANRLMQLARAEALYGNTRTARQLVAEALAISSERFVLGFAADALAFAEDTAGAQSLIDRSARDLPPTDTLGQQIFLPIRRATVELNRGRPATALEALAPFDQYDCRCRTNPLYVRARAQADAGRSTEAVATFRTIIGVSKADIDVLTPFAHLGLARVAAKSGIRQRHGGRIRICLHSGRTPIPTCPRCKRPERNTRH
jgi:tetratricopeptide (TPR) repeat protein